MSLTGFTVVFLISQGAIAFVDNIGSDLDRRTNLSGAIPCDFANATEEFSFTEVDRMSILPPM